MTIFAPLRRDGSPFALRSRYPADAFARRCLPLSFLRYLACASCRWIRRAARGTLRSSSAALGNPLRRRRTSTNTIDTRWRSPDDRTPRHTRLRRAGPALLAPNHWTPIRGSGKDISSSREPPRKGTRARSANPGPHLPSGKASPASLKQTADRLAPRTSGYWPDSREQSPADSRERLRSMS